jgi:hypothetical protein
LRQITIEVHWYESRARRASPEVAGTKNQDLAEDSPDYRSFGGGLMRTLLAALLVAGGVGLAGTSAVSAAPTTGLALGDAAKLTGGVAEQAHWRYRSRWWHRHHRYHYRHRSRWY